MINYTLIQPKFNNYSGVLVVDFITERERREQNWGARLSTNRRFWRVTPKANDGLPCSAMTLNLAPERKRGGASLRFFIGSRFAPGVSD